jgi:hypothetical protein
MDRCMPTTDGADPTIEEADRRVERAKASLLSRVELLKHKITDAKDRLDLPAQIARYPLPAVGVAFALGVAAGLGRRSAVPGSIASPSEAPGARSLRSAAFTALAAIGLRLVREVALGKLSQVARQWWFEHEGASAAGGSFTEDSASRLRDIEPFLEH